MSLNDLKMDLNQKIAIVTGVSKGIGKALCEKLLNHGAIVYGLGRNNNDLKHSGYQFISCDIRRLTEVEEAIHSVLNKHPQIDILINNAGLGYFGFLEDMPTEQWLTMFDTNVHGIFYCTRMVLPGMKQQQYGHIVNIASTAALEGMPQVSGYCGTKWAVKGISESLFREVRDFRIKVTCVYPGSVKTDFFRNSPSVQPHDYMLMPEDVAQAIIQALQTPDNFHTVNLEVRPLQPKGPKG